MKAAQAILRRCRRVAAPPEDQTILQWAEANRRLKDGVSSIEGPFRAQPAQRFILDAISSGRYSEHVWMIAAQTVKTEAINCVVGYFIDALPCGIFVVYPTLDGAKSYSKKKLARMIDSTRSLRAKVKTSRTRDSGNTILSKEFRGGDIVLAGTNSPASLRATSRKVVIQDEIDSYKESAGEEGDPCALADTRAENYPDAVLIKASTPTVKGASRIDALFEDSTRHRCHVPCPHCDTFQVLQWSQVKWEKDKPETARYVCEAAHCGKPWTDDQRIRAIHQGKWIAENPDHHRLGAQMSGLYRLIGLKNNYQNFLHEFASVFLDRKRKGLMSLRAWINTFLAEPFEETTEVVPAEVLQARAERYLDEDRPLEFGQPSPPRSTPLLPHGSGALVLVAGVDVQGDRLECEIVAYGSGEETWGVQYTVIPGNPDTLEPWDELDRLLARRWEHPLGYTLTPLICAVDTGHKPEEVYKYSRRSPHRILCVKGSSSSHYGEPILSRPRKSGVKAVPLWMVGTVTAKEFIYSRLRVAEPGPGYMHFPVNPKRGYDAPWYKMLTVERPKRKWVRGRKELVFENPGQARNEALDIRCYAHAAFVRAAPDFDRLEAKIEKLRAEQAPQDAPDRMEQQIEAKAPDAQPVPVVIGPKPEPKPNTYQIAPPVPKVRRANRGSRRSWATTY